MRMPRFLAVTLVVGALAPLPATAQSGDPGAGAPATADPGSTGSVGAANRSITGVGQTKPPGAALGPGEGTSPEVREKSREVNRKIDTGICIGCND
ncbi:hypothetical protein OPKNFCMD_0129 [Methylobacterium crusticola]|uniref:Uncharacterized protein n=1 Tax=Methylobacterium crusticola TaxID=1697972 RepID=A0ABQ4QRU4_9HYPH|nr:hypothetical protein [Methylobacterium crusticola]GJD47421.1 hypothetical protein OPKNFCMD_0129 [Methylobacterium crusticola]